MALRKDGNFKNLKFDSTNFTAKVRITCVLPNGFPDLIFFARKCKSLTRIFFSFSGHFPVRGNRTELLEEEG